MPGKTNLLCRAALFLRHLSDSEFEDLTIEGGGQVGINANNISNLRFSNIRIHHVGAAAYEPGVLIDEMLGDVKFSRLEVGDSGGGAIQLHQRFNRGRFLCDRCTLAQNERPGSAPFLIDGEVRGEGSLGLELSNLDLHDNAASAIRMEASDRSSLSVSLSASTAQRLGGSVLEVLAQQSSRARVSVDNVQITAPGTRDRSLLDVQLRGGASGTAKACVDLRANRFSLAGGGRPSIHLGGEAGSVMTVVGDGLLPLSLALEKANPGSSVAIDLPKAALRFSASCDSQW